MIFARSKPDLLRASAVLAAFLLSSVAFMLPAQQKLRWSVDAGAVVENREGDDYYSPDQTLAFTRLSPEVGMSFLGGKHNIMAGASWYQPIGNGWKDCKLSPTVYYRYTSPSLKLSIGMFPRTQLIETIPTAFMSDSLRYLEPNIRGALVQYVHRRGHAELALDWRSIQTETQREAFSIYASGRWNAVGPLFVGCRLQMNHLAKTKHPDKGQSVNDDLMANPFAGVDLGRYLPRMDSLSLAAGALVSMQRDRSIGQWHTPCGAAIEATAEWRFLGIDEHLYAGRNLMPLYPKYGSLLNLGDPSYQAKLYSRTTVRAYIFRNQFVNLYASLDFHYTPEAFTFWQKVSLRVYVDDILWRDGKNRGTKLKRYY